MRLEIRSTFATAALVTSLWSMVAASADAQEPPTPQHPALAVAHAALAAISEEDPVGLTDLMIEGASMFALSRAGTPPRVTTRSEQRGRPMTSDFVERGFDGEVRVTGRLATVWLPYDFYTDGEWSHCGVDVFTMVRMDDRWRIASLAYTVEQPPACEPHPDGPPSAR